MNWEPTVTRSARIYVRECPSPFAPEFGGAGRHDVQVHIYAEDPRDGFVPASGAITQIHVPKKTQADITVHKKPGDAAPDSQNPVLTIEATGTDRGEAVKTLALTLDQVIIDGVPTSLSFIQAVLESDRFERGDIGSEFISEDYPDGFRGGEVNGGHARKIAALWALTPAESPNPLGLTLSCQDQIFSYQIQIDSDLPKARVTVDDPSDKAAIEFDITLDKAADRRLILARIDGKSVFVQRHQDRQGGYIHYRGCRYHVQSGP